MPKKLTDRKQKVQKKKLGELLVKCRGEISLRKVADQIGLPPSNLKYIEDGVNAPTGEVFGKLIAVLNPDAKTRSKMDKLYMAIREVPPQDVCNVIIMNQELVSVFRLLNGVVLNPVQIQELQKQILRIVKENKNGVADHAEDL